MSDWNRQVIEEFRANGGKVGGAFAGADLLLLTSTGARSGEPHPTPLGYLADGGRLLVFASNAGGPRNPAWYHNVRADPRVTVEVGTETFDGVAIPVEGEERDRLYARQAERVPAYAEYQRTTGRVIPVVAVHRGSLDGRAWALGDELVKIHDDLRTRLAELREDVRAFYDGSRGVPDLASRLREHCVSVCDVLGEHHDNEEGRGFPRLAAQFPGLAPVIGRLRREHVKVAEARRTLQTLLDDPGARDPAAVRTELDRMTAELEAHFACEEEQLGSVLNAVGPLWLTGPPRG
ncbi:nitroreductase family deazaflavin-dependent oxidoreductase [Actinomadura darangshiensis]|uniref:Nitroreductase family deazaflavin-dependent oxidoreductase n=1 Tax=Actinomadura darangshiensis TaxID=705336 RepID=A0A4R5BUA1_9ACTN|nr:nitroreductase/quinone reductase family protein [Actinomadura darangshiensis]TDD90668.1 nitroreductase family deazaflavin-dependent oxidoreductase [Actinomadura darangshiensis]